MIHEGRNVELVHVWKIVSVNFNTQEHWPTKKIHGKDGYPIYRRRNDGRTIEVYVIKINNQWVVPYNPYLLIINNCHIDVEVFSGIKAIKYIYIKGTINVSYT